jgi:hypothetical protein
MNNLNLDANFLINVGHGIIYQLVGLIQVPLAAVDEDLATFMQENLQYALTT